VSSTAGSTDQSHEECTWHKCKGSGSRGGGCDGTVVQQWTNAERFDVCGKHGCVVYVDFIKL
jgi:hypothetical protein